MRQKQKKTVKGEFYYIFIRNKGCSSCIRRNLNAFKNGVSKKCTLAHCFKITFAHLYLLKKNIFHIPLVGKVRKINFSNISVNKYDKYDLVYFKIHFYSLNVFA